MRATDLLKAAGDLGSESEVAMLVTGVGLVFAEGMLVAQCADRDVLVLTDHPVDGEMLRGITGDHVRVEHRP